MPNDLNILSRVSLAPAHLILTSTAAVVFRAVASIWMERAIRSESYQLLGLRRPAAEAWGALLVTIHLLRLLGRLHPAIVHFPIALLVVAAALEAWQVLRRKPSLAPATPVCVFLGAMSPALASLFGWFLAEGEDTELLSLHKWVGLATTGLAVVAALLVRKAERLVGELRHGSCIRSQEKCLSKGSANRMVGDA